MDFIRLRVETPFPTNRNTMNRQNHSTDMKVNLNDIFLDIVTVSDAVLAGRQSS